ncbi:hypothetical protein FLONG3_9461 [Fusarium longipes]|uniref:Uncharacterized protein n=1 Tax=Fusarium longipes TaxID=694270 RepID=A0A395RWZ9_9HYPO|nr:hypothetical protein FLONG3_9461 [Fusarium longipes]
MDRMPNQGSSGADQPQNIDALDDIILGGYEQWGQVSSQCESTKDRSDLNDNNDVSVWLWGQSNSQLAQDTFINSQSLPQRKHETQKILGVIDDCLMFNSF